MPLVEGVDEAMIGTALLDLHQLGREAGVPVAGWHPAWHYVWLRDSSLAAVAFARTGHLSDAEQILDFLQAQQPVSGLFAPRYRIDGTGPPDGREVQLDGIGWALWSLAEVAEAQPADQRRAFVERYRPLLDRSSTAALRLVDRPRALPPASPDYWELPERRLTLATAAMINAVWGPLRPRTRRWVTPSGRRRWSRPGHRSTDAVHRAFGPDGYPRRLGGREDSVDLGAAFLLPPYAATARPDVVAAWQHGSAVMIRPAGGLAPGGSWRRDGVSWTNVVASYAMTAAAIGDRDTAIGWLTWLAAHRTANGSLPEKVLADGTPASVAPLAWTAAAVIITADTLTHAASRSRRLALRQAQGTCSWLVLETAPPHGTSPASL